MSFALALSVPGAIPNLDALTSIVGDWLDRDDLNPKIPTFISLAEELFNREIRAPDMEQGPYTFSVTDEDGPLPSDFLALRSIYVEGSPDKPLKGMSPNALKMEFDGTSGDVKAYALVSGGIRLAPPPSAQTLLTMDYFARIEPLSVVAPSNWLLEKHPSAYLYATIAFAEDFVDNPDKASKYLSYAMQVIDRINKTTRNDRFGAGPLAPNAVAQVGGRAKC